MSAPLRNPYDPESDIESYALHHTWNDGAAAERARIVEAIGNTINHCKTKAESDILFRFKEYIEQGAHARETK